MSKKLVSIPEPCLVKSSAMTKCEGGFYCDLCQKNVLDLRHKPTSEVEKALDKNPGACVLMDAKHVQRPVMGKGLVLFLQKNRFKHAAAVLLGISLLFSSCTMRKKNVRGRYIRSADLKKTEQHG